MLPLGKLLGVFGTRFLSPPNIFLEFAFAVDTIFEILLSNMNYFNLLSPYIKTENINTNLVSIFHF
ncbi:hypothetical protein [Clostridium faecium]|uniref:hypothetical protein n=1 Tax=Clostridium faecium TaxID=2762223 RepID=UPI0017826C88|nr:hypothetical protein [Clostridium faecium]